MSDVTSATPTSTPNAPVPAPEGAAPTGTPAPTEAPTQKTPTPEEARLAANFAALTRKEQAAQKALAEAKAEKAEAIRLKQEADAEKAKWAGYKGKPERVLELMKEFEVTYDQATQIYLNGGVPTPEMQIQQLNARIDASEQARKDEIAAAEAAKVQAEKQRMAEAEKTFKDQISEHVKDTAAYPFLDHYAQGDRNAKTNEVYALIDGHYMRTGAILPIAEAAKKIDDHLRAQATEAQKLLNPPQAIPQAPTPEPSAPAKQQPGAFTSTTAPQAKTLTPSTTPTTIPAKPRRYMSKHEAIQETLAKFRK